MEVNSMAETGVFESVISYFKKQEWDDVSISKTMLDNGDVEFNVFLKSREQTFMKTYSKTEFEKLVRTSFNNFGAIKVVVCGASVCYLYDLNFERIAQR